MNKILYISMLIISMVIAGFAQIILKKGAGQKNIYINKYTIVGYSLMVISTFFSLISYKEVELSLSGVLQSVCFIIVPVLSYFMLKEKISKETAIGIGIIIIGLIIYAI